MSSETLISYIGDPTFVGWITVAIYLVATFRCAYIAVASKRMGGSYQFWLYLALFLLCLAINKQLDLQTLFEQNMKAMAQEHGWYEQKVMMQQVFIVMLGFGMLVALMSFRLFITNTWRNYALTWMGVVMLCVFILVRAAAFNRIELVINREFLGVSLNALMEISAVLLIIMGTFFNRKQVHSAFADTISASDYVPIKKEGDVVRCPQCGTQPLSKTRDERLFKCRSCGFKYTVRVTHI